MKVPFSKDPKPITDQVEILQRRGMCFDDVSIAEHYLRHLNYYRLGAYWLPFEADHETHRFKPGTNFQRVVDHYLFDRELRLLVLSAIERVEVSMRSMWAHHMGMEHGPFAHLKPHLFKDLQHGDRNLTEMQRELSRSHELFVRHFRDKYVDPTPPVWAVCEVLSLGLLSKCFANLRDNRTRSLISKPFGIDHDVLASWMQHLTYVRNICAHHGRLWNRELTVTAKIPRTKPRHLVNEMSSSIRGISNTLILLDHLLSVIEPNNTWKTTVVNLIDTYMIDSLRMGFPLNHNWLHKS